ncbi:MAG TPA: hypothetical protein GX520_04835 [Syntrophaceticus sp.]|nr:hypothetical protein [Syntrophaceticus sp.]
MADGKPDGIVEDIKSMVVEYNPEASSAFKKPYSELKNELLCARLTNTTEGQRNISKQNPAEHSDHHQADRLHL